MNPIRLRTEYLDSPLGISVREPRFFWQCENGSSQSAYQIICTREKEIVWDSGKVASGKTTHIRYGGEKLNSRDRVEWKLCIWDENDVPGEWASSNFELGLLDANDWKARWISGNYKPKKNTRYPADYFRKRFCLSGRKIERARLYITACGFYEASINGKAVEGFMYAPGLTDYRVKLQYQTYDVTDMLGEENSLEIILADGIYRGSSGCFGPTNVFGDETKLLCQLEMRFEDGSTQTLCSGRDFEWCNDGPIRFADMKDGEIYDATMSPSYGGRARLTRHNIVPTASNNVAPTAHERFSPVLITTPSGKKVLDFGQNIAGTLEISIKGQKGQRIKLSFGETLDENGEFTQKNFQILKPAKTPSMLVSVLHATGALSKLKNIKTTLTPKQELTFICSGAQDEYRMRFGYFGFRYALVETEGAFSPENFTAVAVYSNMEQTGSFSCSNALVNRFWLNTLWSMKGNYMDIPTDCPTRERLGWTGDAQIFFNTAAYNMDVSAFFTKWIDDLSYSLDKKGQPNAVVPFMSYDFVYRGTGASAGWADAIVLVPYRFYKRYGDIELLRNFYPTMRKFAQFLINNCGPRSSKSYTDNPYRKYIYEKGMQLGEWLEPEEFRDAPASAAALFPDVCTAQLHYTMSMLSEIAGLLGKEDDRRLFEEYSQGARNAFCEMYLKNGAIDTDRQASLVRPLAWGVCDGDDELKKAMAARLARAVENRNYKVGTGFLSTAFLLPTLSENGYANIAYRMMESENSPSWLAEVNAGATTVWEEWEGRNGSLNHYSPGAVCEWLYSYVGGIKQNGENRFIIKPIPGGTLTFANTSYNSLYGEVVSNWKIDGERTSFCISVPANCTATIILPNGEMHEVCAGRFEYEI